MRSASSSPAPAPTARSGVKAIKERGGLTIAQGADHAPPRHTGMPDSAIASGLVDLVLPVEQMPAGAGRLSRSERRHHSRARRAGRTRPANGDGRRARRSATSCASALGTISAATRTRTFLRRVQRRMQVLQTADLDAYIERLRQEPDEASLLFRDLLIGVTNFFRDAEAFAALEQLVMPRLFEGKGPGDTAAGLGARAAPPARRPTRSPSCCASGRATRRAARDQDLRHRHRRAGAARWRAPARYPAALLDAVSPERLRRFFVEDGGSLCRRAGRCATCASSPPTA